MPKKEEMVEYHTEHGTYNVPKKEHEETVQRVKENSRRETQEIMARRKAERQQVADGDLAREAADIGSDAIADAQAEEPGGAPDEPVLSRDTLDYLFRDYDLSAVAARARTEAILRGAIADSAKDKHRKTAADLLSREAGKLVKKGGRTIIKAAKSAGGERVREEYHGMPGTPAIEVASITSSKDTMKSLGAKEMHRISKEERYMETAPSMTEVGEKLVARHANLCHQCKAAEAKRYMRTM